MTKTSIIKNVLLIVLVCIFAYLLFTNKDENMQVVSKKPEPLVEVKTPEINQQSIAKKIKPKKTIESVKTDWLEGYDKEKDKTPEVGLIQAFREFRKVKRCRKIIEGIANGKDVYQNYLTFIKKYKLNKSKELSILQLPVFNRWTDSCVEFMDSDNELYTAVHERFRKRFYQTKPKTKLEKDFAKSWPFKEETIYINFKYDNFINGFDQNNKQLVKLIKKQIRHAEGMLGYINLNDDIEFSTRTADEILMYENQLNELTNIMNGVIAIDDDYLVNLYQEYAVNNNKLNLFLQQNTSADAFLTLVPVMFKNKNLELGFYDSRYYQKLLPVISQLYACSMDAVCDEMSKEMIYICFNSRVTDEAACGQAVVDYYLGHYFSPNQLMDVDKILNYFFEYYAKN